MKLSSKQIFVAVLILISVFFDGIRDANIVRYVNWFFWHFCKWMSMFSLWIGMLWLGGFFTKVAWRWCVVLAGLSMALWWLGAEIKL